MKTTALILLFIAIALLSIGQNINVQGGLSFSKMDYDIKGLDEKLYDKQITGYSFLVGTDYFETKYFNLSSNIGVLRKGGQDEIMFSNENGDDLGYRTVETTLDYITINTTIDLTYGLEHLGDPFVGIGPRLDYLINYSDTFKDLDESGDLNKYNIGLNVCVGYKYEISKIMFGLRADFYTNFMKIAEWDNGSIDDQTYTITITIGYKLK